MKNKVRLSRSISKPGQSLLLPICLVGLFVPQLGAGADSQTQGEAPRRPSYLFEKCAIECQKILDKAFEECDRRFGIENEEELNLCQQKAQESYVAALKKCPPNVGRSR